MAVDAGIIVANPPWYDVGGERVKGKEAMKEFLKDGKIIAELEEWIGNTGYSTVNMEIEEAVKLVEE